LIVNNFALSIMKSRLGYDIKRAQYLLRHNLDKALREVGLTTAQYALLSALEGQPDASNADLSRACFVTPQTTIVTLKAMEAAGLITRLPHPQNRRIIMTALTPAGRGKLAAAETLVDEVEDRMAQGIEEDDRQRLAELLEVCYLNLADDENGGGGA
jgi:DNA-binding MarR family transcriptional regulator